MAVKRWMVRPDFFLFPALLLLTGAWPLLPPLLLAALFHELGHLLALGILGGRLLGVTLGLTGVSFQVDTRRLSYGGEALAALTGPAFSLLLAVGAALLGRRWGSPWWYVLSGVSTALGLFNLLPVSVLDGGRCVFMLLQSFFGPAAARTASGALDGALCGLLWVAGLLGCVRTGGNFSLLLAAASLTIYCCKRREKDVRL